MIHDKLTHPGHSNDNSLSHQFIEFISNIIDPREMEKITDTEEFVNTIEKYEDYGDAIFQELVNLFAENTEFSIMELLTDFGDFHRTLIVKQN